MATPRRLWAALLGVAAVVAALMLAATAVGPLLRSVIGPPAGYGSDVTSRAAYFQALAAQLLCTIFVFLVLGITLGSRMGIVRWQSALWVANPITVGLAYWIFRHIASAGWPYEYRAYHGWLILTLLGPCVLVPCVTYGARLGAR